MIEFFFDCSSPWTYLAFHNIQPLAKELGAEISWRPILVGGIFNTINPSVYASRETPVPAKVNYQKKDMADCGDKDISKDDVLNEICKTVGVDPAKFFAGISEQATKDQLKANTDEVMVRGGFGSPTIFIDQTDMYFGNDRMPLIREALQRRKASAA